MKNDISCNNVFVATDISHSYIKPNGQFINILNNISFALKEREIVSIIGPSGCGKSTFLRILAGIEEPTCGQINYSYSNKNSLPPVPIVMQTAALLPWETVYGNIALCQRLLGQRNQPNKIISYINQMGLSEFSDFLPKDLSGGMKARVSIARALIGAQKLIFFDEAFTELDEITRQYLNDIFNKQVEQDKLAAVVISHDINEAVYLASRVIVLTQRPATIAKIFHIPLEYPRTPELRHSSKFIDIVKDIREFSKKIWEHKIII